MNVIEEEKQVSSISEWRPKIIAKTPWKVSRTRHLHARYATFLPGLHSHTPHFHFSIQISVPIHRLAHFPSLLHTIEVQKLIATLSDHLFAHRWTCFFFQSLNSHTIRHIISIYVAEFPYLASSDLQSCLNPSLKSFCSLTMRSTFLQQTMASNERSLLRRVPVLEARLSTVLEKDVARVD